MFGVDDVLDDVHWVNVQDPIKQMFLAITKAIRIQSVTIRDLERKTSEYCNENQIDYKINKAIDNVCTKDAATQILHQIDNKINIKDYNHLENKFNQAISEISTLQNNIHEHELTISDLNARLSLYEKELITLKNSSNEQISQYIDRQCTHIVNDIDRKLLLKADSKHVENCIPERLEGLYRQMNIKINDIKVDIEKAATKEQFQILVNQKADLNELKTLSAGLADRTTRHELHQSVNNHVKPLVTALTSLESAIQIQEHMNKQNYGQFMEKAAALERMYQEQLDYRLSNAMNSSGNAPASVDKVHTIVADIVRDRRLGEVNQLHLDMSISQQTEYMLKQMSILAESIRLDVTTANREELCEARSEFQQIKSQVSESSKVINDKHDKVHKALKELSMNVAKALSKKLDVRDYKKLTKDAFIEHEVKNNTFVTNSRNLLKNPFESTSKNKDMSDTNKEFDYLLENIRQNNEKGSSDTNSQYMSEDEDFNYDSMDNNPRNESKTPKSVTKSTKKTISSKTKYVDKTPMSASIMTAKKAAVASHREQPIKSMIASLTKQLESQQTEIHRLQQSHSQLLSSSTPHNTLMKPFPSSINNSSNLLYNSPLRGSSGGTTTQLNTPVMRSQFMMNSSLFNQPSMDPHTTSSTANHTNTNNSSYNIGSSSSYNGGGVASNYHMNNLATATLAEMEKLDWRLAIGEISMNLRREMADKASREEVYASIRTEVEHLEQKLSMLQKEVDSHAKAVDVSKVDNEITALKHKVAGELTGARFLWTTGHLVEKNWIPWDIQVVNAAPAIITWQKNSTMLKIRLPVFTTEQAVLQLYLNDEPVFSYQPEPQISPNTTTATSVLAAATGKDPISKGINNSISNLNNNALTTTQKIFKTDRYYLRRLHHSAGEVSCLSIDEYMSLPSEATLSVQFHSTIVAQGFISIKKM